MEQEMNLDEKLKRIVREVNEIRKEVIVLRFTHRAPEPGNRIKTWRRLAEKVSSKWQGPSALEEIRSQREKSW